MKTLDDDKKLPEKIAILRLDTDWYESSKFELIKLYDRVVDGGIIILWRFLKKKSIQKKQLCIVKRKT